MRAFGALPGFYGCQRREQQLDEHPGVSARAREDGIRSARLAKDSSAGSVSLRRRPFGDQAFVDGTQASLERRVDGRAERDRLAVHGAARGDHEVGVGDQRLGVDRVGRDDEAGNRAQLGALVGGAGQQDDLDARRSRRRRGRAASTSANRSLAKR